MTHWTQAQYEDFLRRKGESLAPGNPEALAPHLALGRLPTGAMNKTESLYAEHLRHEEQAGRIVWFKFEAIKLRLADATFYTPDFLVLPSDGILEAHEVKGFWRDDARVKIKVAASLFPIRFIAITRTKGGSWVRESFS
jgi:hypothetical protein